MNGADHYTTAEQLVDDARSVPAVPGGLGRIYGDHARAEMIAAAQVHATLALAAATADQTMSRGPGDVGPGWLEVLK